MQASRGQEARQVINRHEEIEDDEIRAYRVDEGGKGRGDIFEGVHLHP